MIIIDNIEYLTVKESAQLLHLNEITIRRWIDSGKLKKFTLSPRKMLVKKSDLKEMIK